MTKNFIVATLLAGTAAFSFAQAPAATTSPVRPMPAPASVVGVPTPAAMAPAGATGAAVAPVREATTDKSMTNAEKMAAKKAAKHGKPTTKKAKKMKKADKPAA
ncbi:MAG: hypothetical protein ABIN96_15800 [Rubrivivax sp.]